MVNQFLVRQPLITVQQVDDAAVAKTVFQQDVLHDVVVAVGVRPQVGDLCIAPVEASGSYAMGILPAGQAVDGAVGLHIVQPLPVVDAGIRGILSYDEDEGGHRAAGFIQAKVAVATGDVLHDDFLRGIAFGPLVHVATAAHDAAAAVVEVHQDGEVGGSGWADLYHNLYYLRSIFNASLKSLFISFVFPLMFKGGLYLQI